jgi:hypothetical protein
VDDGANASGGQVVDDPLHFSATSHDPLALRQVVVLGWGVQTPTDPVRLHASHPPVHAVLQQTPLTQKPDAHWLFVVHVNPMDESYSWAVFVGRSVAPSTMPPDKSTRLFPSNIAVCPRTAGLMVVISDVQVVPPFQICEEDSDVVPPSEEPPATSTCPSLSSPAVVGSNVAVCKKRAADIVPAPPHVPFPEVPAVSWVASDWVSGVAPVRCPPTTSRLPFARRVAVWLSRAAGRTVPATHVVVPLKICTLVTLADPVFPPTTITLPFRFEFPEPAISVAV